MLPCILDSVPQIIFIILYAIDRREQHHKKYDRTRKRTNVAQTLANRRGRTGIDADDRNRDALYDFLFFVRI